VAAAGASGGAKDGRDEYFADAGRFIIEKEKASIGMLQRVFKIGFNRAARIMDQLADAGVVGEEEGTKPRKVLMTMEEFETFLSLGD
jgi:S-DNA-T family DNA segregation ATPase FtsK/SpoIIIE